MMIHCSLNWESDLRTTHVIYKDCSDSSETSAIMEFIHKGCSESSKTSAVMGI